MEVLTFQSNAVIRFGNGGEWHLPSVKQDRGHYEKGVGQEAEDHLDHGGASSGTVVVPHIYGLKVDELKALHPHATSPMPKFQLCSPWVGIRTRS